MRGLLTVAPRERWTAVFLATTVATSVTGFGFPVDRGLPSHVVGIIALVVLTIAIVARYARHLAGPWRRVYVITAAAALYLNVFVGIVQAFMRSNSVGCARRATRLDAPSTLPLANILIAYSAKGA